MPVRQFPDDQLALCGMWFEVVETADAWHDDGPVGEGESASIRVSTPVGLLGIAKPGQPKHDGHKRAAHEKLAFDLAHLLELPVPPVVLWDRGAGFADNRYLSISAKAFRQCEKWNVAQDRGIITEALRNSASPAASAMRVFHTWISDTDRKPDHTYVNLDSPPDQLGVAFIDHAFSMSYVWKGENDNAGACPSYMPAPEQRDVMVATADAIAAVSDANIDRLVTRVPITYLPEPERRNILANLKSRRATLKGILGIV